jgi:uncharacterized phiE125 gp8 family phage protein
MLSPSALSLDSDMLDEVKAYLRLETDADDTPLAAMLLAAIGHAEAFTRTLLLLRAVREIRPASSHWQLLGAAPVQALTKVTGIPAEGATFVLDQSAYTFEIDAQQRGPLRILRPGSAGRVEIEYTAGLSANWSELPESLRLGVLRLSGHYYAHRDAPDDAGPPAAIAALLRPWRRMVLS